MVEERPICEVKGCGNIAQACQGHRCNAHALPLLFAHEEAGPLLTPCLMVDGAGHHAKDYGKALLQGGKTMAAHRWAWTLGVGPIPPGMWVLHRCDRPGCVALDHLYLGTVADNHADMLVRGRGPRPLSRAQVVAIRAALVAGESRRSIRQRLGIAKTTMQAIATGRTYRDVVL